MNLQEIINREEQTFDIQELIFVIEQYIFDTKKVKVKIVIPPFPPMLYIQQVNRANEAFEHAREYYKK